MKKALAVLCAAACLCLSGCGAMLERSYSSSTPHVDKPTTAEDPSILQVEDYRQLVSAVLYLVTQGQEQGVIQLHNYTGPADADLAAACAEVATQDPLGAYCVERIEHECTRVVSYYQASVSIRYCRSREQVASIVRVTGAGGIRKALGRALERHDREAVLRVINFNTDAGAMTRLLRQAYLEAPAAALGLPRAELRVCPDSGRERVVEFILTYPEPPEVLREKAQEVQEALREFPSHAGEDAAGIARQCGEELRKRVVYDVEADATVYGALVEGRTNDEGLALGYALVCRRQGLDCRVVEGTVDDRDRMWNVVVLPGGEALYFDLAAGLSQGSDAQTLYAAGYRWETSPGQTR